MYDHFHGIYVDAAGAEHEIEGGFAGFPKDWNRRSPLAQIEWWRARCIDWGMPPDARMKRLWLAG